MDRRALPAACVVVVALADLVGAHGFAFLVLLGALLATAYAALASLADGARLQFALGSLATGLLLAAAASRAPLDEQGVVPILSTTALGACLVVLTLSGLAGVAFELQQGKRAGRVVGDVDPRLRDEEREQRDRAANQDSRLKQPLRRRRAA